jgi:hypothetical protein
MPPRGAKRKSRQTARPDISKGGPPSNKLTIPRPPKDACAINIENNLHLPVLRDGEQRPWFLYDQVQPAPLFRRLPANYDRTRNRKDNALSEGDESDELSETPGDGRKPVAVPCYV